MRVDGLVLCLALLARLRVTRSNRFLGGGLLLVPPPKKNPTGLVVIGEDTKGAVQTVLENIGLWDASSWDYVGHYHGKLKSIISVSGDRAVMEKTVYRLRKYIKTNESARVTSACEILSDFLSAATDGVFFVVVVSLAPALASQPKNCTDKLKERQFRGIEMAVTSSSGSDRLEWLMEGLQRASGVDGANKVIPFLFQVKLPKRNDQRGWKEFQMNRTSFARKMQTLGRVIDKGPEKPAECYTAPPDRSGCNSPQLAVCLSLKPVPFGETTRNCLSEKETCRTCFYDHRITTPGTTEGEGDLQPEAAKSTQTKLDEEIETSSFPSFLQGSQMVETSSAKAPKQDGGKKNSSPSWAIALGVAAIILIVAVIVSFFLILFGPVLYLKRKNEKFTKPFFKQAVPSEEVSTFSASAQTQQESKSPSEGDETVEESATSVPLESKDSSKQGSLTDFLKVEKENHEELGDLIETQGTNTGNLASSVPITSVEDATTLRNARS